MHSSHDKAFVYHSRSLLFKPYLMHLKYILQHFAVKTLVLQLNMATRPNMATFLSKSINSGWVEATPPLSDCLEAAWCCWLLLLTATLCSSCRSVHCSLFQQLFQFLTVSFIILTHTIIWLLDLPHLTIPTQSTRYTGCVWLRNNVTWVSWPCALKCYVVFGFGI